MKRLMALFAGLVLFTGCVSNHQSSEWSALHSSFMKPLPGHSARVSSWDTSGGNGDAYRILPGKTCVLADIEGPGIIRHIWITTRGDEPFNRTHVLRMYWDGSDSPAVEVPLGDFFLSGNGLEAEAYSWPVSVISRGRAKNCWWPMPFSDGARITVTNEGATTNLAFYCYIDYLALDDEPPSPERFYAQYRQAVPADFPENYTIFETRGSGYFVGCLLNIESTKPSWWGEGDDLIEIDDNTPLRGTGTEDYFNDAWGMRVHNTLWHGATICEGFDDKDLNTSMYRFHVMDPISFKKKIRFSIEHGTGNNRADNLSSVAFWYQDQNPPEFPPLPDVGLRLTGEAARTFIRKQSWNVASTDDEASVEKLERLRLNYRTKENKLLINGLIAYVKGKKNPTENNLNDMNKIADELDELIESIPEEDRYEKPEVARDTDDDNLIPGPVLIARRILERARLDLSMRVALKRGFKKGDEFIVESRNPLGELTPSPTYSETEDFINSYAKVDDTKLMGSGARFTYGNADPSRAKFTPDFPVSGKYEVFVIFSYGSNAGDTRYEVCSEEGKKTIPLKQIGRPGSEGRNNRKWHSLGTYRFQKGRDSGNGSVTLNASPGKAVPNDQFEYRAYSDSVRFVYMGE